MRVRQVGFAERTSRFVRQKSGRHEWFATPAAPARSETAGREGGSAPAPAANTPAWQGYGKQGCFWPRAAWQMPPSAAWASSAFSENASASTGSAARARSRMRCAPTDRFRGYTHPMPQHYPPRRAAALRPAHASRPRQTRRGGCRCCKGWCPVHRGGGIGAWVTC